MLKRSLANFRHIFKSNSFLNGVNGIQGFKCGWLMSWDVSQLQRIIQQLLNVFWDLFFVKHDNSWCYLWIAQSLNVLIGLSSSKPPPFLSCCLDSIWRAVKPSVSLSYSTLTLHVQWVNSIKWKCLCLCSITLQTLSNIDICDFGEV